MNDLLNQVKLTRLKGEKLHRILDAESTSKLGRLNKSSQRQAIRQVLIHDYMKKELEKQNVKVPIKLVSQVQYIKIKDLDEEVQQMQFDNEEYARKLHERFKKKQMSKNGVNKQQVLSLHEEQIQSAGQQISNRESKSVLEKSQNQLEEEEEESKLEVRQETISQLEENVIDEEEIKDVEESEKGSQLEGDDPWANQQKISNQRKKKNNTARLGTRRQSPCLQAMFKAVSREQRESTQTVKIQFQFFFQKYRREIPSVGRYNPHYQFVEKQLHQVNLARNEPKITLSKLEFDRAKLFAKISPCQTSLQQKYITQPKVSPRQQSQIRQLNKLTINVVSPQDQNESFDKPDEEIPDSHNISKDYESPEKNYSPQYGQVNLKNFQKISQQYKSRQEKQQLIRTTIFRKQYDTARKEQSSLPQSQCRHITKHHCGNSLVGSQNNELPIIISKYKRPLGDLSFHKYSGRKELFETNLKMNIFSPQTQQVRRNKNLVPKLSMTPLKERIIKNLL